MTRKPIKIMPEDLEFWSKTTERDVFRNAHKVCKSHLNAGRTVTIVWHSAHRIVVIPNTSPSPFRKRTRKVS